MTELNLRDIRDEDGYYRDGLEALRRALVWIREDDGRDECEIPLPAAAGAVQVMFNGGVPFYFSNAAEPHLDNFTETTASGAVSILEGLYATTQGIPVDPQLPEDFDNTPNDERPDSHQVWWHRPFIVTDRWEPETWEQYRDRLAGYGWEPDHTPDEWAQMQAQQERCWHESFPSGMRYDVRCLDGGAWDRSTWWGSFGTLEEAQECARSGPQWRTVAG